jgi:hypothetical protein
VSVSIPEVDFFPQTLPLPPQLPGIGVGGLSIRTKATDGPQRGIHRRRSASEARRRSSVIRPMTLRLRGSTLRCPRRRPGSSPSRIEAGAPEQRNLSRWTQVGGTGIRRHVARIVPKVTTKGDNRTGSGIARFVEGGGDVQTSYRRVVLGTVGGLPECPC